MLCTMTSSIFSKYKINVAQNEKQKNTLHSNISKLPLKFTIFFFKNCGGLGLWRPARAVLAGCVQGIARKTIVGSEVLGGID